MDKQALLNELYSLIGTQVLDVTELEIAGIELLLRKTETLASQQIPEEEVWRIRISNCAWRLETADEFVCGSGDAVEKQNLNRGALTTKSLIRVEVEFPSLETKFVFNNTLTLIVFPVVYRTETVFLTIIGPADRTLEVSLTQMRRRDAFSTDQAN